MRFVYTCLLSILSVSQSVMIKFSNLLTIVMLPFLAASFKAQANDSTGAWGPLINFPIIPIHNVMMPDGRVMLFGSDRNGEINAPSELVYLVWDPSLGNGSNSWSLIANSTQTDIFCAAQVVLPGSGSVFTAGGDVSTAANIGNADTTIFNPQTNTMTNAQQMSTLRWYPSLITLSNGELLIQGGNLFGVSGSIAATTPEVFTPGIGWRSLVGATSDYAYGLQQRKWWYPRSWVISDGSVFGLSGTSMFYLDTSGAGTLTPAGTFPTSNNGLTSTAVMFATDKVLQVGGGNYNSVGGVNASPFASIVDLSGSSPAITQASQPQFARHWANTTLLADGQIMLSGGSLSSNSLSQGYYDTPELWNPNTDNWSSMAPEGVARLYHSNAILLPDATVFSNGGGSPGPVQQFNGKVFYPPYLFDGNQPAVRPTYTLAEDDFVYGESLAMSTSGSNPISRAVLIKTSSVTHSFNVDQRIVELGFSTSGSTLTATIPSDPNLATPGFYMLFLIDSAGTPSVANIISVSDGNSAFNDNLVQDGGFESINPPTDGWLSFNSGASLGPWTVGGSGVDLHENSHRSLGAGGADGRAHIDLRGNNGGVIAQTINGLIPGSIYTLRFNYALHAIAGGVASANVSIAGLDETFFSTVVGSQDWSSGSYTFTANSATETLTFSGLSSAGNPYTGVLVDGVSIKSGVATNTGSLIQDGGFESILPPAGGWLEISTGASVGPWAVNGSGIDLHENTHRNLGAGGADGNAHIDLRGNTGGGISQMVNGLIPGHQYIVSFNYAMHDLAGTAATANVTIAGLNRVINATVTGSVDWIPVSYAFTATSSSETLTFEGQSSTSNAYTGVLIDGVAVSGWIGHNSASLVQDGGFESITPRAGGWSSMSAGTSIGPWTVGGSGVDLHDNAHRNLGAGGADGNAHIDLRGNYGGTVAQTVSGLIPGAKYTLGFNFALHYLADGAATANVSIAGLNRVITATVVGSQNWTSAGHVFTANNSSETLTFSGLSSSGNPYTGVLIDGVSLRPGIENATGSLVQDGEFESLTPAPGGWLSFNAGASIGPWTVGGSGVDLHENTTRNLGAGGAGGRSHIDLRGNNSGSIAQTIKELIPGQTYTLEFNYALHDLAGGTATAKVSIAGLNQSITATVIGSQNWAPASYTFTANSSSETLTFAAVSSAGNPYTGVLIDSVEILQPQLDQSTL